MALRGSTPTEGTDSGEPTTSTSQQDASTTAGNPAAQANQGTPSSEGGGATAQQGAVTRVQIEEAPKDPDVLYPGAQDATDPERKHVKADYQPFEW